MSSEGNGESSITETSSTPDPLLTLLVGKGLLTTEEVRAISAGTAESQRDRLASLLRDKGLISAAEFDQLRAPVPSRTAVFAATTSRSVTLPQEPPAPTVIAAVAPIRLLPIDVPQREGLIPDLIRVRGEN